MGYSQAEASSKEGLPIFDFPEKNIPWHILHREKLTLSFVIALLLGSVLLSSSTVLEQEETYREAMVIIGFFAVLVGASLASFFSSRDFHAEVLWLKEFARINNYSYEKSTPLKEEKGIIFSENLIKPERGLHVISGVFNRKPFRMFSYHFVPLGSTPRHAITMRIINISLSKRLPQIFLDYKGKTSPAILSFLSLNKLQKISLESNEWNKSFSLYVKSGNQILALQLFAPDIMENIMKIERPEDIEIIDDQLYIYQVFVPDKYGRALGVKYQTKSMFVTAKPILDNIFKEVDGVTKL